MYHCPECQKPVDTCPNCKQRLGDNAAVFLYQISGGLLLIALVFVALEIKIKEEIDTAMRPFKVAEEVAAKKSKVKAVKLPTAPKAAKEPMEKKEGEDSKPDKIEGKDADFRAGRWGVSRKRIEEEEKAEKLDCGNPYSLEFLAKVGNYEGITRYEFSSNRLEGGNYIVFGQRVKDLDKLKSETAIRAGDPCFAWIQNEFSLYRFPRNEGLSEVSAIDNFFYEMYISLSSQFGMPEQSSLKDLENALSRQEKVASVLAFDRMISYEWSSPRSKISFIFAANVGVPYFYISYRDKNAGK